MRFFLIKIIDGVHNKDVLKLNIAKDTQKTGF